MPVTHEEGDRYSYGPPEQSRGIVNWQTAGLITQRLKVRVLPPQPFSVQN